METHKHRSKNCSDSLDKQYSWGCRFTALTTAKKYIMQVCVANLQYGKIHLLLKQLKRNLLVIAN